MRLDECQYFPMSTARITLIDGASLDESTFKNLSVRITLTDDASLDESATTSQCPLPG